MVITLLQTDIEWNNQSLNIRRAESLMDTCQGSDLYVLPEMWSTGFATQPEGIAHDEKDNEALLWMHRVSSERKCAICGSLAVRLPDGSYRNRHYFVDGRSHQEAFYDKHHLFTYGGQFAGFFRLVLETEKGAVLYHCTQGKDRTGIASALLMAALGASREAIVADFDASQGN